MDGPNPASSPPILASSQQNHANSQGVLQSVRAPTTPPHPRPAVRARGPPSPTPPLAKPDNIPHHQRRRRACSRRGGSLWLGATPTRSCCSRFGGGAAGRLGSSPCCWCWCCQLIGVGFGCPPATNGDTLKPLDKASPPSKADKPEPPKPRHAGPGHPRRPRRALPGAGPRRRGAAHLPPRARVVAAAGGQERRAMWALSPPPFLLRPPLLAWRFLGCGFVAA